MFVKKSMLSGLTLCAALAAAPMAHAAVTEVEGAAGGGIVPWALLAPPTPTASFTYVNTGDFSLTSLGVSGSLFKRVELSYARQTFDINTLGLGSKGAGGSLHVDTFGAKVKLLDMSRYLPQVAVGTMYKINEDKSKIRALRGIGVNIAHFNGVDFYVAGTKVVKVAGKTVLLDATVRLTKANQAGILGFGGNGAGNSDSYSAQGEFSGGLFVASNAIVGAEYRMMPDNLKGSGIKQNDWWDVYFAYLPSPHYSLTLAYANIGKIVVPGRQQGLYLQVQASY